MAPSSSDQNGAVCTATTLPLNSGMSAGAAIAWRKATMLADWSLSPPTPITPITNGIFGAFRSLRTSRMKWASSSEYMA